MAVKLEKDLQHQNAQARDSEYQSAGVYPPSFCTLRLLLTVMVITELAVVLLGMGRGGLPGWKWLGMASVYAQWLALFCASGVCVTSGWTSRLKARGAWIGSWSIVVLLSAVFSYAAWLVVGASGFGLVHETATMFMLKTVFSVGLVAVVFFRYLLIRRKWRSELMAQSEARLRVMQSLPRLAACVAETGRTTNAARIAVCTARDIGNPLEFPFPGNRDNRKGDRRQAIPFPEATMHGSHAGCKQ